MIKNVRKAAVALLGSAMLIGAIAPTANASSQSVCDSFITTAASPDVSPAHSHFLQVLFMAYC